MSEFTQPHEYRRQFKFPFIFFQGGFSKATVYSRLVFFSGLGDHDERGGVEPVRGGGSQPPQGVAEVAHGQDRQVGLGEVLREYRQPRLEVLAHLGEDYLINYLFCRLIN